MRKRKIPPLSSSGPRRGPSSIRVGFLSKIGIGEDRDYFMESLGLLLAANMDILAAIRAIRQEVRTPQMRKAIDGMQERLEDGSFIWRVLEETDLFDSYIVSLVRTGEESGTLPQSIRIVMRQQEKARDFRARLRSAMMYPLLLLAVTLFVGVGIAWLILPRLSKVFDQLDVELPKITQALMGFSSFLGEKGFWFIPSLFAVLIISFCVAFLFRRTRHIGQFLLLHLPVIHRLIKEVELSRMAHILGTMLQEGIPLVESLRSAASATRIRRFSRLCEQMADEIDEGKPFKDIFSRQKFVRQLIPAPIQQMIVAGERSGSLPEVFQKIGETFEAKSQNTTRDFSVLLEPLLLVIIWLGVVMVALAVILPIYSLVGNFGGQSPSNSPAPSSARIQETDRSFENLPEEGPTPSLLEKPSDPTPLSSSPNDLESEPLPQLAEPFQELAPPLPSLTVLVPSLNVRESPAVTAPVVGRVARGEIHPFLSQADGWYQIRMPDASLGWVFGSYVNPLADVPFQ